MATSLGMLFTSHPSLKLVRNPNKDGTACIPKARFHLQSSFFHHFGNVAWNGIVVECKSADQTVDVVIDCFAVACFLSLQEWSSLLH